MAKQILNGFDGIKKYYNTYGYFPTIREICEITGRSSTATIKDHLDKLEKKYANKTDQESLMMKSCQIEIIWYNEKLQKLTN